MAKVRLYSPTGNPEVINTADVEEKLAAGYKTSEQWLAEREEANRQEREAWLANPDTLEERFRLLRQMRDGKISATDYLMASDYPLAEEKRGLVTAYRQALRDLPAQDGAPWDGGGEHTPWPVLSI